MSATFGEEIHPQYVAICIFASTGLCIIRADHQLFPVDIHKCEMIGPPAPVFSTWDPDGHSYKGYPVQFRLGDAPAPTIIISSWTFFAIWMDKVPTYKQLRAAANAAMEKRRRK